MMRRIAGVFLLLAVPVAAQEPPLPEDYVLHSYLDLPMANAFVSRVGFYAAGWVFECRSGLQPLTQRVGSVVVSFTTPGSVYKPTQYTMLGPFRRPDVQAAFGPSCPAVGEWTGYIIYVADLPPPGAWQVRVSWATWDGANHVIYRHTTRDITVID